MKTSSEIEQSMANEQSTLEDGDPLSPDQLVESPDEGDLQIAAPPTISLDKLNRSIFELHRSYKRGLLIIDPEWQRKFVWDRKRASRLIESLLINLPIPVIYLAANDQKKYEVIDGLQRLTSIFEFLENKYALKGLEFKAEFNDRRFKELPPEIQNAIENAYLQTFELAATTPKNMMFLIFERLNTGGVALNDMEIRNCLFRGPLNDLLSELAQDENFKRSVNQKGIERRMADRMLVMRFLAFYQMTYFKARNGLKPFFNEFFSTYRLLNEDKLAEFRETFREAMRACYTVFGNRAFRLRKEDTGGWALRVNAAVFQVISVCFTDYDRGTITRSADSIFEAYTDMISSDQTWREAVSSSTGMQSRIDYAFEAWKKRLRKAISGTVPNDTSRFFSKALKMELFEQNNKCALCNQDIVLIDDAALDHKEQYWEGGKTVPANARLAHRHCNLTRPRISD
jgi:hypothetical protein